jgi:hypothetical protein
MRPASGQGIGGKLRGSASNWNTVAKVAALLVVCHILAVVILSAQSTAAGGPLVLFPLASLWQDGGDRGQVSQNLNPDVQAIKYTGALPLRGCTLAAWR